VPKRRIFIFVLIFLLIAGGAGAYFFFRPQITSWIESLIVKEETGGEETGGEETEETYCPLGQIYENSRQGYKVCYPAGWHTQEFVYSQLSAGFDPAPIPEASEYGGMIHAAVRREGSASLIAQYLLNLETPATSAVMLDGVSGIKLLGTIPAGNVFFPGYFQAYTVFEGHGRTYVVQLLSSPDGYEQNLLTYEEFIDSFRFLDEVPPVPWGEDIYLQTPWPGDSVSGSFRIAGSAQGAFESTIVARLKTSDGTVLFEEPITYDAPDVGELGYFDIAVTYSTASTSGTLEVFHTSAVDGSVVDIVTVPLLFE